MHTRGYSWCWMVPTAAARPPRRPGWPSGCAAWGGKSLPAATRAARRSETGCGACFWSVARWRSRCAELFLFMAARAQLVDEVIAPALAAGRVVVSDRYLLANIVYQGSAGGLLEEEIALVGMVATAGLMPDLTIVLDITPEAARARVGPARDRIEERPTFYHERVRAGYLGVAQAPQAANGSQADESTCYPAPIVVVDASLDSETVFARIQAEVTRRFGLDPRGARVGDDPVRDQLKGG